MDQRCADALAHWGITGTLDTFVTFDTFDTDTFDARTVDTTEATETKPATVEAAPSADATRCTCGGQGSDAAHRVHQRRRRGPRRRRPVHPGRVRRPTRRTRRRRTHPRRPRPHDRLQRARLHLAKTRHRPRSAGSSTTAPPSTNPPHPWNASSKPATSTAAPPAASARAVTCDLDHIHPFSQGGHTSACNLQPLCARHHKLKHEAGWNVEVHDDGTTIWVTPTGIRTQIAPATLPTDTTAQHPTALLATLTAATASAASTANPIDTDLTLDIQWWHKKAG